MACWLDSHCHLQGEEDPVATVARAKAEGVAGMVCVGTDVASSRRAIELAASIGPGVWATAGLHPHDAARRGSEGVDGIAALLGAEGLVAIGECGLDYHYDHSPREDQRRAFAEQVALAHRHGLALVVHSREAWDDTFDILGSEGVPPRTVFHCFTGGPVQARRCLDLGAWLSFSGIVTFVSAGEVREAAALCPPDRLLVETDAPFLSPVPHRGRRNEPRMVRVVGEVVAKTRGEDAEVVAETSARAARELFGIAAPWPPS